MVPGNAILVPSSSANLYTLSCWIRWLDPHGPLDTQVFEHIKCISTCLLCKMVLILNWSCHAAERWRNLELMEYYLNLAFTCRVAGIPWPAGFQTFIFKERDHARAPSRSRSITLLISIPGALFLVLLNNLTHRSISFFITLLAYLRRAIHSSPAIFICERLRIYWHSSCFRSTGSDPKILFCDGTESGDYNLL